jgi:hypothetical protein
MSGLMQGEVIRPTTVEAGLQVPDSPAYEGSNLPFDLKHAGAWEFMEKLDFSPEPRRGALRTWKVEPIAKGGEWLPVVDDFRYNPGANGCREVGTGASARVDGKPHLLGMQQKENVVTIQNGMDRRMGPYQHFRARFPYQGGGWFYCYAGVSLRPISPTRAIPEADHGWTVGMRRQCVDAGVIPPMDISVLDREIALLENRLSEHRRAAEAGNLPPGMFERREREVADKIARMRAAWDRQFGSGDPNAPLVQAQPATDDLVMGDDTVGPPEVPAPVAPRRRGGA